MSKGKLVSLGSVMIGDEFVFRTAEVFGSAYSGRKPPFEEKMLTVVGFRPRYRNNVIVRDPDGVEFLVPSDMVEEA